MGENPQKRTPAKATPASADPQLVNEANPQGQQDVTTGPVGDAEVIDAQEHVLGDDPRRVKAQTEGGFHDSLTGRSVDSNGYFTDTAIKGGEGPVPQHRIVANDWPNRQEKIDDSAKREGNEAS